MSASKRRVYSVLIAAVVVAAVAAAGFTGVISASQFTQPNYDPATSSISFVSFCAVGSGGPADGDITDVELETLEYNGEEKQWQVSFNVADGATVDYLVLKGGSSNSPHGYLLRVDDPVSPVSVFGGQDDGMYTDLTGSFPTDFNRDRTCLAGDSGVKFD
jgi:hypothetical protein